MTQFSELEASSKITFLVAMVTDRYIFRKSPNGYCTIQNIKTGIYPLIYTDRTQVFIQHKLRLH